MFIILFMGFSSFVWMKKVLVLRKIIAKIKDLHFKGP